MCSVLDHPVVRIIENSIKVSLMIQGLGIVNLNRTFNLYLQLKLNFYLVEISTVQIVFH